MAASSSRSEDLPLESCTRTPPFLGWTCYICSAKVLVPDLKMVHSEKIHCVPCYNKMLVSTGQPEITERTFRRTSKLQHKVITSGLPASILKQTKRAAQFKRTPEEVEEAMKQLSEAQEQQLLAATDYLAIITNGIAGMYVCRDVELIDRQLLKRMKTRNGLVRQVEREDNTRCCDIIPQMNHWRGTQGSFRCAAGGHRYQPWAESKAKPGYIVC